MAVNQSQVDHIITAASEDDPEVKLQNLEREVDLIKTSIKRLLMDIRERMNELENPFTLNAPITGGVPAVAPAPVMVPVEEEAAESEEETGEGEAASKEKTEPGKKSKVPEPSDERAPALDENMIALLRSQAAGLQKNAIPLMPQAPPASEKLRLQKVYKLFKWTNQAVKKFGHDRLEIMLESYRAMGYITKESCEEIREISRLMPANLGEEHEVGPDEFVAELYALNHILVPNDTSLDRDMIEVMMEKRQVETPVKEPATAERIEFTGSPMRENPPFIRKKDKNEEWMNLPDRI